MINVKQVKVDVRNSNDLLKETAKKLRLNANLITRLDIVKRSIDARDKDRILYVYEVNVFFDREEDYLKRNSNPDISKYDDTPYEFVISGKRKIKNNILVVGMGPAGLFTALTLLENGFPVTLIERGEPVEERVKSVEKFWDTNELNINSNVQFGEGGAGTFSDGKLNSLVKDPIRRGKKVFETFVECGANKDILYVNNPHVGTDKLRKVIINLREKIIKLGGVIRYNTKLTDIKVDSNNKLKGVYVNDSEYIETDVLALCIGHSARDTFEVLSTKLEMEPKAFAVGVRVEHKQEVINENQYGSYKDILGPASYKLTHQCLNNRGVYSFCMCPGGFVVNSSSENNQISVNGMSNSKRDTENANSAIIVTITPDDFGTNPLDGIYFQRELEKKAFELGNGLIPVQLLGDYMNNTESTEFKTINPIFKGSTNFANLNLLFPEYINESLKESFTEFGKKIIGFDDPNTILAGIESRTSSPVRIIRNENYESNIEGIYPCGEGCGYAGGITSAAIDGIKVAEMIAKKYHN